MRPPLVLTALLLLSGPPGSRAQRVRMDAGRTVQNATDFAVTDPRFGDEAPPQGRARVVLVALEGLGTRDLGPSTPGLLALAPEGSHARVEAPSGGFLPYMGSILTGVDPRRHGVVRDRFVPGGGMLQSMSLFDQTRLFATPAVMLGSHRKIRHLVRPGTIDRFRSTGRYARRGVEEALEVLGDPRVRLMFLHLGEAQRAGQAHGFGSEAHRGAVAATDRAVARLHRGQTGPRSRVVLFLLLDPSRSPEGSNVLALGYRVWEGRSMGRPHPGRIAATTLWLLGLPFPRFWQRRPLVQGFDPPRLALREGGDTPRGG